MVVRETVMVAVSGGPVLAMPRTWPMYGRSVTLPAVSVALTVFSITVPGSVSARSPVRSSMVAVAPGRSIGKFHVGLLLVVGEIIAGGDAPRYLSAPGR